MTRFRRPGRQETARLGCNLCRMPQERIILRIFGYTGSVMNRRCIRTVSVLLSAAFLAFGGRSFGADEAARPVPAGGAVVRKIINAYGGAAEIQKIRSLSARGVLDSPMYEKRAAYSFDLARDGRKLRVEIRAGSSSEVRILNGAKGYVRTGDSPLAPASGPRVLAMIYQFKELTMPFQLLKSSFTIAFGGGSTVHGAPADVLLLEDGEGPPMKLYVDPRSGRILKDSGSFVMEGAEMELSSEFHDFRRVGGRLLPFRIVNYAGGERIGELRIKEYTVNPELPGALFMPGNGMEGERPAVHSLR